MTTSSDLFQLTSRLCTGWLLTLLLSGLWGCDQATSPTSPSSPTPAGLSASAPATGQKPLTDAPASTAISESDKRPKIVAFGDSLTAGLGVSPEQTYPAQLQQQLDALGYHYQVLNAGVSGDTSAGGLRRVRWMLAGKPRVVILELGGNDGLRGLSLAETHSHLDRIITQLKDSHVQVLLAGMKLPPNYGKDYTTKFEAMYQDLARVHSLPLIPFLLEGVGGEKRFNQADGIHPTGEGYRIVVDNVLKNLLPILTKGGSEAQEEKRRRDILPPVSSTGAVSHAIRSRGAG